MNSLLLLPVARVEEPTCGSGSPYLGGQGVGAGTNRGGLARMGWVFLVLLSCMRTAVLMGWAGVVRQASCICPTLYPLRRYSNVFAHAHR